MNQVSDRTRQCPFTQAVIGVVQGMLEAGGTGLSISKLWDCTQDEFSGLLLSSSEPKAQEQGLGLTAWGFAVAARGQDSAFMFHVLACRSAENAEELLALLQTNQALEASRTGQEFGVSFPPPEPFQLKERPQGEGVEPAHLASGYDWDTHPESEECLSSRSYCGGLACGPFVVRAFAMNNLGTPTVGHLWTSLLSNLKHASDLGMHLVER
jgi:hypothetical protein